jgi:hypothetical protein
VSGAAPTQPTSPAPSSGPGGAVPWYRDPLFAATIGAWVLAAVNRGAGLDLPTTGTVAAGVGLALLWGAHVVVLDLEALRTRHHLAVTSQQAASTAAAFAPLGTAMEALLQHLPAPAPVPRPPAPVTPIRPPPGGGGQPGQEPGPAGNNPGGTDA